MMKDIYFWSQEKPSNTHFTILQDSSKERQWLWPRDTQFLEKTKWPDPISVKITEESEGFRTIIAVMLGLKDLKAYPGEVKLLH